MADEIDASLINEVLPNRSFEPWLFETLNVREMLAEAKRIIERGSPGSEGIYEYELLVAINHLKHAADELERSRLEKAYGVTRHGR